MAARRKIKAKRRSDGRLDQRTKKGREISERMRNARASKKKSIWKRIFFFW